MREEKPDPIFELLREAVEADYSDKEWKQFFKGIKLEVLEQVIDSEYFWEWELWYHLDYEHLDTLFMEHGADEFPLEWLGSDYFLFVDFVMQHAPNIAKAALNNQTVTQKMLSVFDEEINDGNPIYDNRSYEIFFYALSQNNTTLVDRLFPKLMEHFTEEISSKYYDSTSVNSISYWSLKDVGFKNLELFGSRFEVFSLNSLSDEERRTLLSNLLIEQGWIRVFFFLIAELVRLEKVLTGLVDWIEPNTSLIDVRMAPYRLFEMEELSGLEILFSELIPKEPDIRSYEELRSKIYSTALSKAINQIESGGSVSGFDIDKLSDTEAAVLIPKITEIRQERLKASKVILYDNICVDYRPIVLTQPGLKILQALGLWVFGTLESLTRVKNAYAEIGIDLSVETEFGNTKFNESEISMAGIQLSSSMKEKEFRDAIKAISKTRPPKTTHLLLDIIGDPNTYELPEEAGDVDVDYFTTPYFRANIDILRPAIEALYHINPEKAKRIIKEILDIFPRKFQYKHETDYEAKMFVDWILEGFTRDLRRYLDDK